MDDPKQKIRKNPFNPITHPDAHLDWSRYWEGVVKRSHRGLELKAKKGRLVHVRETYSEREI